MTKKSNNIFGILTESVGLYFSNFSKFIKYMSFPVLGQLAGLVIVLALTYAFSSNIGTFLEKYPVLNDFNILFLTTIVITLPGLVLLTKALWEYLVAYGAVNSMVDNMAKSGKVYDFDAHTELIKRRTFQYIILWFLVGIFSLLAICPIFWIICGILAVYFILIFQVFTYEQDKSSIGCFKRSFELVKGNFASTFVLAALIGAITYIVIPQIFIKIFDIAGINNLLNNLIIPFISNIQLPDISAYGLTPITESDLSLSIIKIVIAQIFIQYTLPLRTILWAKWYDNLSKTNPSSRLLNVKTSSKRKTSKKRPSEKLMEQSNKKYSKTRIDKNILRRAMEKDSED